MLGGIIGPMVEEAAVKAADQSLSKPFSSIALISTTPIAEASATAAPDIPATMILEITFT